MGRGVGGRGDGQAMTPGKRPVITPLFLSEAGAVVAKLHRHHEPPQGGLFAVGLSVDDEVVGAAIVGRPIARNNDDGFTAEVVRVATGGIKNGCSMLYGACWRAARALGYRRLITYTLPEEGGASLRASGFRLIGSAGGGSWSSIGRPRVDKNPLQPKLRWEKP